MEASTPSSAKPLSITPGSRVLRSPLSDEQIWKRLRDAGFDEESIRHKDKAALIAYIAKLEAEIYDHQHHMGLLILEKKELASKYDQVKALAESSELIHKRDSAMNKSALTESRKREENLKKAVSVKDTCIASLEKALHELRTESAETKVAAESKFAEARQLIDEAQKKITEAEAKVRAAESLHADANRYHNLAERKLRDVEAREDNLRRQIISFKSDCDEKDKEMILERQSLSERQKGLQQEQERLLQSQALLNQREDQFLSRSQELNRLQKELEDTKLKIEKEHVVLHNEKTALKLKEATLIQQEEELAKWKTELNQKEQELLEFQVKLSNKESDDTQKVIAGQEADMRTKRYNLEVELQMQRKLVENEIETKRRAWELKEVDLKHYEDQILERQHELEVLSRSLSEKEKDVKDLLSAIEEKDQRLSAAEKEFELNKALLQKEKDDIEQAKQDLQKSLASLENKTRQVDIEKERLEAVKSEAGDLSILEVKLKEEIDLVRSQNLELLAEADKLKAEKAKFEAEWELLDEKKEELRKEADFIAKERQAVSTFIKNERDQLREEKENLRNQYTQDLGFLASEREKFMNKMALEHAEWFGKMQQERADFLRDIEMQKQELNNLIEKRREEVESYLKEREKAFEEEKNTELQYINALKEKAAKELEQVSLEMKRLQTERAEINLDRERRNREWAELTNCIEELEVQRDKLQKQRELLHADRIEIYSQTEELKKLEDLKAVSDDNAITEMLKSDMESNQKKISARKSLKHQTLTQGGDKIVNGFDTPFVQKSSGVSSVVSPPSPVRFSWIKRCTELIFRNSLEKPLARQEDSPMVSDTDNVSNGQKYLENDRPLGNIGEGQQTAFASEEPKVIVEVPSRDDDARSEFESVAKDVNGKSALLFPDGHHVSRRKRGRGNMTNKVGDPLVDLGRKKKSRAEQTTENPIDQDTTFCVVSTQSDISKVQQVLTSSNQTQGNTEETRVVMIDKVIHVSEVTSEKVDCLPVPSQEPRDNLQGETTDRSNSITRQEDILPCASS
ncbi:protein CROWDED NUCLEI 4 [Cajanus cajan]|uniref:Nuclear matrix constituent protein 1-like protein n=1 Tax=Cajanus cajan TaxID=3821 RepID=A0A151SE82_CAJCA|nr:protein CROWDED NUCLEI 4 [Cajanus cajan]XP_020229600.1 protein CROWDED NUCLEI 4 [Cajanus cajan]KYP53144.1 Putative nuclear matrix constituent protein 1-like protein [Cajanus cajan]